MIGIATKDKFDLTVADDIERLLKIKYKLTYTNRDSVEYLCIEQEVAELKKHLNVEARQSLNLQVFNAELYSHGIRHWGFNNSFMVSEPAVHNNRESEFFIYVPMWAVSEHFRLPSGCGNANQRQLNYRCAVYFGKAHEGKVIEINHPNGAYSAYEFGKQPIELSDNFKYWITR